MYSNQNEKLVNEKLVMVIDQKRFRIRIHKHALHRLGDPMYIQLLVNPKNLSIAIRPADHTDIMTHRIIKKNFISKQSYELYSRYLIQGLQKICSNWKSDESYRLSGEYIMSENIACFDLGSAFPYSQEADNE